MTASRRPLFRPIHALFLLLIPLLLQGYELARAAAEPVETRSREALRELEAVADRTVSITAQADELEVLPGEGDELRVEAVYVYGSTDEEWMARVDKGFDVRLVETGRRVEIRPEIPPHGVEVGELFHFVWNARSSELRLKVTVPRGTVLEIDNEYGAVSVLEVGGPLTLASSSGEVRVEGAGAPLLIEQRYGDVKVERAAGDVTVRSTSGAVKLAGIGGGAVVEHRYGPIVVEDVAGSVRIDSNGASVQVRGVGGALELEGANESAEIHDVAGPASIKLRSGAVKVDGVRDRLSLESSYGDVRVSRVEGDVEMKTTGAEVSVEEVGGSARVNGSNVPMLRVAGVAGALEVDNPNGAVAAERVGRDVTIRNRHGDVSVAGVGGRLTVETQGSDVDAREIEGGASVDSRYGAVRIAGVGGGVRVSAEGETVVVEGLRGAARSARHSVEVRYGNARFDWPGNLPAPTFRVASSGEAAVSDFPGVRSKEGGLDVLASGSSGESAEPQVAISSVGGRAELLRGAPTAAAATIALPPTEEAPAEAAEAAGEEPAAEPAVEPSVGADGSER